MSERSTSGTVVGVNGNLVVAQLHGPAAQGEVAQIELLDVQLPAEVIGIEGDLASLQVFEDTRGIRVGMPVRLRGELLSVELGPGLLGSIVDGLQRPLPLLPDREGYFLRRGATAPALDPQRRWDFRPTAAAGDTVRAGDPIGEVDELHLRHPTLVPLSLRGSAAVVSVAPAGPVRVHDPVATLRRPDGSELTVTLAQRWPVKRPIQAYEERLYPRERLATGQRIIDTLFPIVRGGTACVPGPFGAGKTVLQQLLARHAAVDVVIVVACGERAGEVVETIDELPRLVDPRTGGSLMERTIIVCNTSSMPVASREASVYTGITLAEYYRQLGLDVLMLADSTSRWAQAMREMSGRLEEIPGEEAFPAYLDSRIAGLYERAGLVRLRDGSTGSVTLIGTVSPAGGNFEEPVTQATLKVVGAFHGLSRARSDQRKYPAIDPLDSWSRYAERLDPADPPWAQAVGWIRRLLARAAEVGRMMTVVGEEGVGLDDLVAHLAAETVDATYLQQNAFDEVDAATSMARQRADLLRLREVLATPWRFADKAAARALFTELSDAFYQKAYCEPGTEAHAEADRRIDQLVADATAADVNEIEAGAA